MFLKPTLLNIRVTFIFTLIAVSIFAQQPRRNNAINRSQPSKKDTTTLSPLNEAVLDTAIAKSAINSSLRWKDRFLNRYAERTPQSPLYLKDPKNITTDFRVKPDSKEISITEKVGKNLDYRLPQKISFNDYSSIQNAYVRRSILREYENMQDGKSATSGRGLKPLLEKNPIVDRIFGGNTQDLKPNGFVTLDFQYISQFIDNPFLPLNLRKQNLFNFNQQININFNGKIGDKLGMLGNLDTKAAFNFENQMRLNFKNQPEDILQSVEAGNVSLPNKSQLIPGVQNLFGAKIGLRFGKLDMTVVGAQQRSKTERIVIRNGSQSRNFEVRCDNYEENKHFFLAQFFRDNYEKSLRLMPVVSSGVRIMRVEVYVTNRTNSYESMRNLVGFTDLGENKISTKTANYQTLAGGIAPDNNKSNTLYKLLDNNAEFRKVDKTNEVLNTRLNFAKGIDYEVLRGAKRLTEREYRLNPDLGYISLNTALRNDEILAVAYEYTYNGQTFKVGELTEDYANRPEDEGIALKLIKSSTIRNRTNEPMWNLMMKNIYNLGSPGITKQGFQLRIIYKDDITGIDNPVLQEGIVKDIPLVKLFNLDRLNSNGDPQPDGNVDFVEDITIDTRMGRLIFPVLEPFGSHLRKKFDKDTDKDKLVNKYVFDELYKTTLSDAQQITTKNKFFIRGSMQGGSAAEILLPLGATGQSVRVSAGGTSLQEGVDYQVDPQAGRIKITNQSILNSARDIIIEWEKPDMFNTQIRFLYGTRLDYNLSKDIHIGATYMTLRESPVAGMYRTAIGQEPVNNTIAGLDLNYRKDARWLTRLVDALPLLQTKEMSNIQLTAEYARLFPSVNTKRIRDNAMIDDFEAARNINDLTRQPNRWRLGSTPEEFSSKSNKYEYNYRRAKISAYTIDQSVYFSGGGLGGGSVTNVPDYLLSESQGNLYERGISINNIFPGRSVPSINSTIPLAVLDVAYFPNERGMYNYNPDLTPNGLLAAEGDRAKLRANFGSIMRGITADNDFDNANTEYITFWLLDPFKDAVRDGVVNKINTTGGKLKLHLGDISEDVIPDSRNNFENGIIASGTNSTPVGTFWGKAPSIQFMTDAFDNKQQGSRAVQDVGLDGLNNKEEEGFTNIKTEFLDKVKTRVTNADAIQAIEQDPSNDDYKFFLDEEYNNKRAKLLERFKNYLGMENNSPETTNNQQFTQSTTVTPDKEDVNNDNSINDLENFYEYEIDLKPNGLGVGQGYIVDKVDYDKGSAWYQFRIPIKNFTKKVGDITGFKSVRFIRMVLTEFEQPVVLRFGALQLESNQYRVVNKKFNPADDKRDFEEIPEPQIGNLKQGVVNIDENGNSIDGGSNVKTNTIPYVIPENFGFRRDQDITQQQFGVVFNEQSMTLAVNELKDDDVRAVFKNTRLDLINYKNIRLLIHTHNDKGDESKEVSGAFLRIGTDLTENYYEIEIPKLIPTLKNAKSADEIWKKENQIFMPLAELIKLKAERNTAFARENRKKKYSKDVTIDAYNFDYFNNVLLDPTQIKYKISVVGNPDLSTIVTVMMGVTNPKDDNQAQSFTTWFNELSAFGFDQTSGDAGLLAANIKVADLATVTINGNMKNFGYGGVQDRISERARENNNGFGVAANIELDKLTPEKWGLKIPFFITYDKQTVKPEFNPLDPDMRLDDALSTFKSDAERTEFSKLVVDNSIKKGYNFSNVRKIKTRPDAKNHFFDIENFTFSYAHNNITRSNILIYEYLVNQYKGGFTYQYQPKSKVWEPFKNNKNMDRPFLYWLKDFNLTPTPSVIAFRNNFDRSFSKTLFRNSDLDTVGVAPNFEKYFILNRATSIQWNLSKSLLLTFDGQNNSIIDEPYGEISGGIGLFEIFKNEDNRAEIISSKDSVYRSMGKIGRAKNYTQDIRTTYRVPFDKFFLLDWITGDAKYNVNYGYMASSYNLRDNITDDGVQIGELIGNTIRNGREYGINGRVDFVKLYNKSKYLRFANSPKVTRKRFTRNPADDEEIDIPPPNIAKTFTRVLMAVRGIRYNYQIVETSVLPGFLPETGFFGLDRVTSSFLDSRKETTKYGVAPGLGFVMGSQKYDNFTTMAKNGWLSETSVQTNPLIQTRQKKFDYNTDIEPFKDLKIQINGKMSRGDTYQEYLLKNAKTGEYDRLSPVRTGNFSMSFWALKTSFRRIQVGGDSTKSFYSYQNFDDLVKYREQVKKDLVNNPEYAKGVYDKNSQDVLLPAFFYAYSGRKYNSNSSLNPFKQIPLPNWRLDFAGLANLAPFKKLFSSITISHSYTSTYNVGNFTSSAIYGANDIYFRVMENGRNRIRGYEIGTLIENNLSVPKYVMSTVSLEERFAPFLGIQFVTKSKITGRFDWNKERRAAMNFSNAQINEYNSYDIVGSLGFKKNNVKLPFRGRDGKIITLKNDLNFTMNVTFRDLKVIQRRLDGDAQPVQGNYQVQIRPEIRYQFNKRVGGSFYIDHSVNDPFVSNFSFYRKQTTGGLNVRFALSD